MSLILIILSLSSMCFSASIEFNFTDTTPVDLKVSLAHIADDKTISSNDMKLLKDDIEKINTAFKNLSDTNFLFTIKSTMYSSVLDYKNTDYQQITVKTSDFKIIYDKINAETSLYSKYTVWIFEQMRNDFEEYIKDDYLNSFETAPLTEINAVKKKELERLLSIYSPLIRIYKTYDATKLKNFNTKLALFTIAQVAKKLPYFYYANTMSDNNLQLINYKITNNLAPKPPIEPAQDSKNKKHNTLEALKEIEPKTQKEALDEVNEL